MNPTSARKPVCGTRNGMDMRMANNAISPHISIFSFFISVSMRLCCKDMKNLFIFVCLYNLWNEPYMMLEIIKAFTVGICASAPLGPIAILVIQKSLSGGHKAGFIAGLGACVVDTLYAVVAIFALAVVQEFLTAHQNIILIVGGLVVAMLGISMSFSDPFRKVKKNAGSKVSVTDFMQRVLKIFIKNSLLWCLNVIKLYISKRKRRAIYEK